MTPQDLDRLRYINHLQQLGASRGVGDSSHSIVSITNSGGFCLVTTLAPHGLTDQTIAISGNSVAGYNTTTAVTSVPTTTTFVTEAAYTSSGTGGTWTLA